MSWIKESKNLSTLLPGEGLQLLSKMQFEYKDKNMCKYLYHI